MRKRLSPLVIIALLVVALVIGFVVFTFISRKDLPTVSSIYPPNMSQNIKLFEEMTIEFGTETLPNQQEVTIRITPNTPFSPTWKSETALSIKPTVPFNPSTKYIMEVFYKNIKIASTSFYTTAADKMSLEEQIEYQTFADLFYGQSLQQELQEKPWLASLPFIEDDYVAVYDSEKNHIRVRIKTQLNQTQTQNLQNQITTLIRNIGVPEEIPIFWILP